MSLLTPGAALRYEMADFDASDVYRFKLHDAEDGLALSSAFDGDEPVGAVTFSPDALDRGRTIAVLSQGSWQGDVDDDDITRFEAELPPFLVSRAALQELRAGQTRLRPEWAPPGAEPTTLTLRERLTLTIDAEGEPLEVPVLVAHGDGVELRVIDDERWPLVVERLEGDNYWRLLSLDRNDGAMLSDDDDDDELPPPEPAGPLAPTGRLDLDAFVALCQRLGVQGIDMDYDGTRFSLVDGERRTLIEGDYKVVLVALPGGTLRRAHAFANYAPDQVLGPLASDDPEEHPGGLAEGAAIAGALAARAGADILYPDPLGAVFLALFDLRALAE